MDFKQLNLHREKLLTTIQEYHPSIKVVEEPKHAGLTIFRVSIDEEREGILNVHYNKDGTITLYPDPNKNLELSKEIATAIVANCSIQHFENRTIYIRNLSEEHFNDLLEFLQDCGAVVEDTKNLTGGVQKRIKSMYGDSVFLNRYNNGAIQIQGTHCLVRTWVIEGLVNYLPYNEIIEAQMKSIGIEKNADEIIEEFNNILPTASTGLPEILRTIMSPSVILKYLDTELTDYTMFVMPVLKGLEGYMKLLFFESGVQITNDGFGAFFEFNNDIPRLNEHGKNLINSYKKSSEIDSIYRYYYKNRNSLFHFNGIVQTTRIIPTRDEAVEIIEEVFQIIENAYTRLNA